MKKTLHLCLVFLFFIACKSENERRIIGKWQALELLECDNVIPIQTDLVDIQFFSNGKYIFHSTLNVKEEGEYYIRKNFLFTQDKVREKAPEKAVLIKSIEDDTLVLQMSYKGKDQWLTLVREGETEKVKEKKTVPANIDGTGAPTTVSAITDLAVNPSDSIQKEAEQKKDDADKKSSKADDSNVSPAEAYKKREAKRLADERLAKEEAEKKAAQFRKEYAIREAERKKREGRKN